jgi:hypothetical protein
LLGDKTVRYRENGRNKMVQVAAVFHRFYNEKNHAKTAIRPQRNSITDATKHYRQRHLFLSIEMNKNHIFSSNMNIN